MAERLRVPMGARRRTAEDLLDDLREVVFETDPEGRWTYLNRAWTDLTGFDVEATLGRHFLEFIAPDERSQTYGRFVEVVQSGKQSCEHETCFLTADGGERWVALRAYVERDSGGAVIRNTGALIDVTDRRIAESERRQLEAQLAESQKMEAVGQLAGGIAHDMNNILTAILGYSELLLDRPDLAAARADAAEIHQAASRAANLTSQLLAFSRRQVLQPELLDVTRIVADMEAMLRRLIGAHIELLTRHPDGPAVVRADAGQLGQVVLNLVVNARDAMAAGGRMTIEILCVDADPGGLTLPQVQLVVSDTGVGMDAETLERVFEPFFTTKPPGAGTGLGLSTVHGIVKQSGGDLWVQSEPGRGTTFTIALPRAAGEVSGPNHATTELEVRPGQGETILLVEDDDSVRDFLEEALSRRGFSVLCGRDAAEALALEAKTPSIDLLVTDVVMPNLSGPELVRTLQGRRPDLPVLYLSGHAEGATTDERSFGSAPFLQKPFSSAELIRAVGDALRPAV
jgi:two-component system cell cycle sensor histidine kinase/response regulator CckA